MTSKTSTGWIRLWIVLSVCGLLYGSIWWPLSTVGQMNFGDHYEIQKDYENPECRMYFDIPMKLLTEPKYNSPCYYAYTNRKYYGNSNESFSPDSFLKEKGKLHRYNLYEHMLVGAIASLIFSMIIYLLGRVTNWVTKGFKNNN
jgi:hypothetical protein